MINIQDIVEKAKGIETIVVFDERGIQYQRWNLNTIPVELIATKEDIGKRVWVAGYERAEKSRLVAYRDVGTNMYKNGGYVVDSGYGYTQSFDFDCVIIHPDIYVEKLQQEKLRIKQQKLKNKKEKMEQKAKTEKREKETKTKRTAKNKREHFDSVVIVELNK